MHKKHSEAGAASTAKSTTAFIIILASLIGVNLVYFLSTHTRILHQIHASQTADHDCNRLHFRQVELSSGSTSAASSNGSASSTSAATATLPTPSPAPAVDSTASSEADASVKYLQQVVFADKTHLPRKPMEHYWLQHPTAKNTTVEEYRDKVAAYLNTTAFKQRWDELKAQTTHERGIVISAGGRYYLPQAMVLLRILRHYHRSTLPVEIFYYGDEEMDNSTLQALKADFGPLEGYNAKKLPYPSHHLPGVKLQGFPMKPFALLNSRFKEALLLDCDVVLRRDPAYMFDAPLYKERGNYFWGDIYGVGMVKDEVWEYVGLNRTVKDVINQGKYDFNRYAESGQVMINRAMHLDVMEWTWFLNSFSDHHVYDFMYGDKDTYAVAFGLAGKAHLYQHMNVPPGGVFTHRDTLGWQPREGQMRKQGNWWLMGLVHYDHTGEVLLIHRVTGEVSVPSGHAPTDEVITPPIPHSWSMWWMGYGPETSLQRTLDVVNLNVTYFLASAPAGQACPLAAWSAYWTLRTHGIPVFRNLTLEKRCSSMLDAQYGAAAAAMIRKSQLMDHPLRLVVNAEWDKQVDGGWNAPKHPLWAVPLNQTEAYTMWLNMNASVAWVKNWTEHKSPFLTRGRRRWLLNSWR